MIRRLAPIFAASAFAVLGLGACFSPTFPEGLDCTPEGQCPGSLQCVAGQCISPDNGNCPSGSHQVDFSGSIVTFSPPECVTSILITAFGAEGGGGRDNKGMGGRGAVIEGRFAIALGPEFTILVGEKGKDAVLGSNNPFEQGGGSGGGGTFVVDSNGQPVIVAGGGGGVTDSGTFDPNNNNQILSVNTIPGGHGQVGNDGQDGGDPGAGNGKGGTAGSGGITHTADGELQEGTGGGGFSGPGVGPSTGGGLFGTANLPGSSFQEGGAGGIAGTGGVPPGRNGGFGGGGSAGFTGGGGGGYSGGGSGSASTPEGRGSGGGGSFNNGTDQINIAGDSEMGNVGNGKVIFTW